MQEKGAFCGDSAKKVSVRPPESALSEGLAWLVGRGRKAAADGEGQSLTTTCLPLYCTLTAEAGWKSRAWARSGVT